jgi:hypothetical protein
MPNEVRMFPATPCPRRLSREVEQHREDVRSRVDYSVQFPSHFSLKRIRFHRIALEPQDPDTYGLAELEKCFVINIKDGSYTIEYLSLGLSQTTDPLICGTRAFGADQQTLEDFHLWCPIDGQDDAVTTNPSIEVGTLVLLVEVAPQITPCLVAYRDR